MRTGSSGTRFLGRRGRTGLDVLPRKARKTRHRFVDVEGLEARTLLATIPALRHAFERHADAAAEPDGTVECDHRRRCQQPDGCSRSL